MNIKGGEKIGNSLSPVTDLSAGSWLVDFRTPSGMASETWDIEEPERLVLTEAGALIYIDNHGEIVDVIAAGALLRVKRMLP